MTNPTKTQRILSILVTLGLLLQTLVPTLVLRPPTAVAAQSNTVTSSGALSGPLSGPLNNDHSAQPDSLSQPLTIARVQSTYQAGETAVITYTIRNNQVAKSYPELEAGLTVTDTIAALSDFDPQIDPHTIHNLVVNAELDGATLLDASHWPISSEDQHLFHLGHLLPLADAILTMTVQLPTTTANFVTLDNGVTAQGSMQGRSVTAVAPPIRLAPDGLAPWLAATPDVTLADTAMLLEAAAIGDDPLALFDFVQQFEYEAYEGSLRGTRGTLWSQAGNSVDQSSLLIAFLRANGYPARYRHGTLPLLEAQALITSMFPPTTAVRGHIPAEADVSDPMNDPDLLALAQDHWWVEAYLPNEGWVTLDPTVKTAVAGTTPATPSGGSNDQIAELPNDIRHQLHFVLDVEQYKTFPIGGLNLQQMTVLTATVPAAQTAGTPVYIGFGVNSNNLGGLAFSAVEHLYRPYLEFGADSQVVSGVPVNDLLTTFPLASQYVTGVWLEITSTAPDGRTDTYRRTIKDLVGPDLRMGGNSQLPARGNSPVLQGGDIIQVQPIPNSGFPATEVNRIIHQQLHQLPGLVAAYNAYAALDDSDLIEALAFIETHLDQLYEAQFSQLDLMQAIFQHGTADFEQLIGADSMLVKSYPDRPKLILASQTALEDGSLTNSFELLNIAEKGIAYPGQTLDILPSAQYLRTTSEKTLEYDLLTRFIPGEIRSAVGTLLTAAEQDVPMSSIVAENLSLLAELDIPGSVKAHITEYALAGSLIIVPEQMVMMPYGEDIGFIVINQDGNTFYVNADGYMAAAGEYGLINSKVAIKSLIEGQGMGFAGGFVGYIVTFLGNAIPIIMNLPPATVGDLPGAAIGLLPKGIVISLGIATLQAVKTMGKSCTLSPNASACLSGVGAGYLFVNAALMAAFMAGGGDPSLPDFWISELPVQPVPTTVTLSQTHAADLPAGTVMVDVQANHSWARATDLNSNWTSSGVQAAHFDTLTANSAEISQDGIPLGSGSVTAVTGQAHFSANNRPWSVQGALAAASYSGLGSGLTLSLVGEYTAVAATNTPLSSQLRTEKLTLNNDFFSGELEALFNTSVTIAGTAVAPVPQAASSHTHDLDSGRVMVSDLDGGAIGAITVGGTAVSGIASLAAANYSGPIALTAVGPHDQVEFSGPADFFALALSSDETTLAANDSTRLIPQFYANYNDTYEITVQAPDGWHVGQDIAGQIIVTPTAKSQVGTAVLLVTAQSSQFPDLFTSATISLTVTDSEGVVVTAMPEPLITVPMGVIQTSDFDFPVTLNHLGDGRAEIPGAAFNITLLNQATTPETYALDISGLPADWVLWSLTQPEVSLLPGQSQTIGLYVVPPAGPLLAAGSSYPFTVTAVNMNNGSINDTADGEFTMPALAFPYLTMDPPTQMILPGEIATATLRVQNVGNSPATFPLTATMRNQHFSTAVLSPTLLTSPTTFDTDLLGPNDAYYTTLVVTTTAMTPGGTYFLQAQTHAGEYKPQTLTAIEVATLLTAPIFTTAACLPESMADVTTYLAQTLRSVENDCADGNCSARTRADLLNAIDSYLAVTNHVGYPLDTSDLIAARQAVAAAETTAELVASFPDVANAVVEINEMACFFTQYQVNGRFTPYVEAILLGDSASFSLDVTNQGTLTTSYAITLTGLPDGDQFFNETVAPGTTAHLPVTSTPNTLGNYNLTADIVADIDGEVDVRKTAVARLNVVDKFVQMTQVIADPPFVETGLSSTNLSVEVANFAGVGLSANADVAILAPDGSQQFNTAVPVNILAVNSRIYELTHVDTSGWSEGVYTVTVNLLDADDNLIPDGSGYGYFSVGQALQLSQAVFPEVVAPGTITVTTIITSEITSGQVTVDSGQLTVDRGQVGTMYDAPLTLADLVYLNPTATENRTGFANLSGLGEPALGQPQGVPVQENAVHEDAMEERPFAADITVPLTPSYETYTETHELADDAFAIPHESANALFFSPTFTRTEQDDPAWSYTGTWTNYNLGRASGGSYWYNNTVGSTAQLTFDGTWLSLGFITDSGGGYASITIDGDDYGIIDLYRNQETTNSFLFDGLPAGSHTLEIEVLGTANPFAFSTRVELDYADYGDGSLLPDGNFEEDDPRLLTSNGWASISYAGASGGSYLRAGTGTAWFPFAGDSFTLHSMAHSGAGKVQLFVDGVYLDTIDMFAPVFSSAAITRTFSYEGLGSGPHLLQINSYQNQTTIDKITTPGSGPFINPNPPINGVTRFEADHPTIRYNGVPFTQTATTWVRVANIFANRASAGEHIYSATAGDTVTFDFEGEWLGVGFTTGRFGGQAEIHIDGQLVETIDLYSRYDDTASFYFRELGVGSHTVTVTVLGASHPEAIGSRVHLDFFDVWDGQPLTEGTFEEDDERLMLSSGWGRTLDAEASGGAFASSSSNVTAWFPFTGDSFTYHGRTLYTYQDVELRLNGQTLGQFDIYSYENGFRTYSFDNLGDGPHILEIRYYRASTTVDAVSSPAIEPAWEPPAPAAIVRYEEDHPDMRYNGLPYYTMPQSWALDTLSGWTSSGGNSVNTNTAGNIWSFDFDGEWVNIGLRSTVGGADIRINGVSQGVFDTSGGVNGVKNFPFALDPGSHLVEVEVISGTVAVDYMDVWQGETMDAGWYDAQLDNEETGLFHFSQKQRWLQTADIYAYNGAFLNPSSSINTNIWFNFVGSDLTILGNQRDGTSLHLVIDGVDYGEFDMSTPAPFRGQPYSLHFPDLGEGPHVVQVFLLSSWSSIDAFEVNPDGFHSYMPEIKWHDTTATEELNPTYGTGFLSTIAIGDLNGDGSVELVAPGLNGRLYVYRGDGADTGDGSPILWTSDVAGPVAEAALADLTGDGTAEIVVTGVNGTFAFTHDGSVLWHNPDVASFYVPEQFGWGGASIGNLDLSPEPEIVIASSEDALYVLDHMGNTLWSAPVSDQFVTTPVLADITGDGILDIIVADKWDLRVYDYFNGGQLVWEYTQPDQMEVLGGGGAFGAPAVVDITGDGQPEIIINWGVFVEALRADGSLLWKYDTGHNFHYRPSPVTVADTTGDGQMNIVTASAVGGIVILNHTLMVLDADGNLVWEQLVADNTSSASGVSAQDLTGNGVWEVLWNGSVDGFLVLRGSDGKRLFNEPYTASGTVLDYPTLGDVDGDGVADVVMAGRNGLFVVSHVGHWVDSRPLWNQHNYHVTNINDDWSVPVNEQNSWELHNTYRTQTPERSPAPSYQMVFTYTEGLPDVTVLTETASIPLTAVPPLYGWEYRQEWYQPTITTTFVSLLIGMQPGETRQVSAGTEVDYRLPSGFNTLTLPPLYVTAPGLGELAPAAQSVVIGGTAVYTLTLTNSGSETAVYSLTPGGIPAEWLDYPATVPLGAGETAVVTITVIVPPNANPDTLTLWLDVDNGSGGADDFSAQLTLFQGLELALTPFSQEGTTGQPLTYTLTISNLETAARTYTLMADGLADVSLPNSVIVAGNGAEVVTVTAVPPAHGPQPFTIAATSSSGAAAGVDGVAVGDGRFGILAQFNPDTAITGPGATAVYTLTLTNIGNMADSYNLDLDIPAGWTAELTRFGQPVNTIDLPALFFNSVDLLLLVTPDENALADSYPITLTAVSLNHEGVEATAVAIAEVSERGVSVAISPGSQPVDPTAPATWDVTVTNNGSLADTFDLVVSGVPALAGTLSADAVTLAPGASQTVQLTATNLRFLLPGEQTFAVMAQSQAESEIRAQDRASFTVDPFVDVEVAWRPTSQVVTGTLSTTMAFVITNTGNVDATYVLDFSGTGLRTVAVDSLLTLPRDVMVVLVDVTAVSAGTYELAGTANANGMSATAIATLTFVVDEENQPPVVDAGPDQTVGINQLVQFSSSATDPDGDEIVSIEWDFGDGSTASGTFSPTHTYTAAGSYTVTLTVTDDRGGIGVATLVIDVQQQLYLPLVVRTP